MVEVRQEGTVMKMVFITPSHIQVVITAVSEVVRTSSPHITIIDIEEVT